MLDKIMQLKPILFLSLKVTLPTVIIGFYILPNITTYIMEKQVIKEINVSEETNVSEEMINVSEKEVKVPKEEVVNVSGDCRGCHYNIAAEIQSTSIHTNFDCKVCHSGMSRRISCLKCHKVENFSAHEQFIKWAENNTMMYSSNEACIACHTYAKIKLYNITRKNNLMFSADLRLLHETQ